MQSDRMKNEASISPERMRKGEASVKDGRAGEAAVGEAEVARVKSSEADWSAAEAEEAREAAIAHVSVDIPSALLLLCGPNTVAAQSLSSVLTSHFSVPPHPSPGRIDGSSAEISWAKDVETAHLRTSAPRHRIDPASLSHHSHTRRRHRIAPLHSSSTLVPSSHSPPPFPSSCSLSLFRHVLGTSLHSHSPQQPPPLQCTPSKWHSERRGSHERHLCMTVKRECVALSLLSFNA